MRRSGGFGNLLDQCLGVGQGEQVVLLTDEGTDGQVITRLIESIGARAGIPLVARMPGPPLPAPPPVPRRAAPSRPGSEPPGGGAAIMRGAAPLIGLPSLFTGPSRARRTATE